MAERTVAAELGRLTRGLALSPPRFAALLAAFGLVAGAFLAAWMHLLRTLLLQDLTWTLPVFDAPVVPFVGVPVVLATGWVMLALWHLRARRWALGGLLAALIGLLVAATAGFVPEFGMSPELASALGVMEALVGGVMIADQFECTQSQGVLAGLAVDIWILMGVVLLFHGTLLLTPFLSVAMGVIVASPTLGAAFLIPDGAGLPGGSATAQPHAPYGVGRALRRSRLWLAIAFFALPLGFALSYLVAVVLALN